jgi:hypothetical protein
MFSRLNRKTKLNLIYKQNVIITVFLWRNNMISEENHQL